MKVEHSKDQNGKEDILDIAKNINKLQDELDGFNLTNHDSWEIESLKPLKYEFIPLEIWILKKELEQVEYLFSSQLEDDSKIDNIEERKLYLSIKNLLTEDIFEKSSLKR